MASRNPIQTLSIISDCRVFGDPQARVRVAVKREDTGLFYRTTRRIPSSPALPATGDQSETIIDSNIVDDLDRELSSDPRQIPNNIDFEFYICNDGLDNAIDQCFKCKRIDELPGLKNRILTHLSDRSNVDIALLDAYSPISYETGYYPFLRVDIVRASGAVSTLLSEAPRPFILPWKRQIDAQPPQNDYRPTISVIINRIIGGACANAWSLAGGGFLECLVIAANRKLKRDRKTKPENESV